MRALVVGLAWLTLAGAARADSGALFGESARAVALADAVVARPGDTSALWWNPGGLADVTRPTLLVLGHAGFTRTRFARHGELGETVDERVAGYGLSVVAPLPGPWWLRRVRVGGAVHVPGDAVIHVRVPVRDDTPRSPYYGGRTQRTAATFGFAAELPWTIRLGGAITVSPNLVAPTRVGFDATRGETVDEGVFVEQERVLSLDVSFLLGVRVQPIDELAIGLVWRQGGATRASGTFDVRAGAIRVADEYAFYELLAPEEVALGVAVWPVPGLSLSLDATWGRWSSYRTLHDAAPDPGFSDVVDVRLGAELALHRAIALRAGYGFLPSPVPAQIARDNLLDAHRHELAFGLGVDLEAAARIPARIDLAFRFHARHRQEADKELARVPDASEAPGHLVTNLGYPGFSSTGSFAQVSLAVTFLLDGAASASDSDSGSAPPPSGRGPGGGPATDSDSDSGSAPAPSGRGSGGGPAPESESDSGSAPPPSGRGSGGGPATESETDAALRPRLGRDGELSLRLCVFARNYPTNRAPAANAETSGTSLTRRPVPASLREDGSFPPRRAQEGTAS